MNDFTPLESLDNALKHWWLLVALTLVGGLLGWLVHTQRPALYEAKASFALNTDVTQTGSLTQFEEDYAINMATELITSAGVRAAVFKAAQEAQLLPDASDFPRLHAERRAHLFELRFRHADPQTAAAVANLWVDEAYAQLNQAHQHALNARQLRGYQASLERCLQRSSLSGPSQPLCGFAALPQLQAELQASAAALQAEVQASREITSALVFSVSERPGVPSRPVLSGLNLFILAGSLIGFLLGIWALHLGLPGREVRIFRHA